MTTDRTPNRNPLRALDAVEPTGTWDDVVTRSADGDLLELAPVAARRSIPRPMLAAAAVLAVLAVAAGVFAVTRGDGGTQNLATESAGLVYGSIWNSTWELVALERDGQRWDVESNVGNRPRLTTTQPGVGGISYQACNRGTGTVTVEDDRLVVTEFATTELYCATSDDLDDNIDTTLMDQEVFVTELLGDRPTLVINPPEGDEISGRSNYSLGDRLTLSTANGSATFERTEVGGPVDGGTDGNNPQALWGRIWNVVKITEPGRLGFVAGNPVDGTQLRLDASTTGRLSFNGLNVCNGAGGEFELDGDRLKVIEIGPSTAMGCEQDLMDQDDRLQAFLESEPTVTIVGNQLTLTAGESVIELEAADVAVGRPIGPDAPDGSVSSPPQSPGSAVEPSAPANSQPQPPEETVPPFESNGDPTTIWNRTWRVAKIADGRGRGRQLVAPTDGTPLHLEATTFDANGASGTAIFNGCNGAGGTFELDGNRLVMTKELDTSTAGRCASDDVMAQESQLQAFMNAGPTVVFLGDLLVLATDDTIIDLEAS